MKASVDGHIIAQSDDIVACHGYQYFPQSVVRMDWLQKTEKTASDHACPHGVQFYDVVVDGKRHERAAWQYEKPRPEMAQVGGRFSFWQESKSHRANETIACPWVSLRSTQAAYAAAFLRLASSRASTRATCASIA